MYQAAVDGVGRGGGLHKHNAAGMTRSFVHVYSAKDADDPPLVIKSLEALEFRRNAVAALQGVPVLPPLAIVTLSFDDGSEHYGLVEPRATPLDSEFAEAADGNRHTFASCKRSFDALVRTLEAQGVGGDFKLANVLQLSGGDFVCTDLGPRSWRQWTEAVLLESGRVDDYTSFEHRLRHWQRERAAKARRGSRGK